MTTTSVSGARWTGVGGLRLLLLLLLDLIHVGEYLLLLHGVLNLHLLPVTTSRLWIQLQAQGIEDGLLIHLQIRVPSVPRILLWHLLLLLQLLPRIHYIRR